APRAAAGTPPPGGGRAGAGGGRGAVASPPAGGGGGGGGGEPIQIGGRSQLGGLSRGPRHLSRETLLARSPEDHRAEPALPPELGGKGGEARGVPAMVLLARPGIDVGERAGHGRWSPLQRGLERWL